MKTIVFKYMLPVHYVNVNVQSRNSEASKC